MNLTSLSKLFDKSEEKFTITRPVHEKLEKTVKGIGNYISNNIPSAKTYFQGSFAYGTIVRPYKGDKDGEYDIDFVVELPSSFIGKEPSVVKSAVGDCLKKSDYAKRYVLKEGKRCWTIDYSDMVSEIAFHLDILPSVPANDPSAEGYGKTEIKITNLDRNTRRYSWGVSNPKGYREWFSGIDAKHCNADLLKPASTVATDLNRVTDPVDTTPLRSAIKILKRSRDVFFSNRPDAEFSPISVIITTVAGKIVDSDGTIYNSVAPVLGKIIPNLRKMGPQNNGGWMLENPVDPKENFADRWKDDDNYALAYAAWCDYLAEQWETLIRSDETESKRVIEKMLGLKKDALQNETVSMARPIAATATTPMSYAKKRI